MRKGKVETVAGLEFYHPPPPSPDTLPLDSLATLSETPHFIDRHQSVALLLFTSDSFLNALHWSRISLEEAHYIRAAKFWTVEQIPEFRFTVQLVRPSLSVTFCCLKCHFLLDLCFRKCHLWVSVVQKCQKMYVYVEWCFSTWSETVMRSVIGCT